MYCCSNKFNLNHKLYYINIYKKKSIQFKKIKLILSTKNKIIYTFHLKFNIESADNYYCNIHRII